MMRIAAAIGVVALLLPLGTAPSVAQQALLLKTDYPAVVVEAGTSVTFDIDVVTPTPRRVDLAVTQLPPGWTSTLRGGGFVIDGVFGDPETPPQVELEVQIPPEAGVGANSILVRGSGGGAENVLELRVTVSESAVGGAITISSEFPRVRGGADETFTINATLQNNTPDETTFNLSASGPTGWVVEAQPTQEARAATVTVEGGGEAQIQVTADPPDGVSAGTYEITVEAAGPEGRSAQETFEAVITGSTDLQLTTGDERLNVDAVAGRATELVLVVQNTGSAPLRGVSFAATPPTGWEVAYDPERIETVEPGEDGRVTASIVPSGEAVAGDYQVQITATGENGGTGSVDMRVAVRASRFWLVVGILLIVATFLALRWVFRRYGRR